MYKNYLKLVGNKVITSINIPINSTILSFSGNLYERKSLIHNMDQVLQIGQDRFIGPSGTIDDYIRHSCNPNCYIHIAGNCATLYSLYVIPINTEITFDYSVNSTDSSEEWQIECNCGDFNCRKIISGFHSLDDKIKENYLKKDIVPLFITNPIFFKKI